MAGGGSIRRVAWPEWWQVVLALAAGLLLAWAALVAVLWRAGSRRPGLASVARLLPDLLRLVARLARDRDLPCRVRLLLWLLLAYLASPVDLVPDVVPVVGLLDDLVAVVLVLGAVLRAAGEPALRRHWPGREDGLRAVLALTGAPPPSGRQGAGEQQDVDEAGQPDPVRDEDAEGVGGHVAQEPVDRGERHEEGDAGREQGRPPGDR